MQQFLLSTPELAMGLAYGLGALGPGLAIGIIGFAALSGIARNPSASKEIKGTMILAIAFAEALAIFALLVVLILKFVK